MLRDKFSPYPWILPRLTLAMLGVIVFGRVLSHGILRWDDAMHISENPYLYPPWTWDKLLDLWQNPYFGLYIPMTYSLWGVVKIWSTDPIVFHSLNLAVHVANACLILGVLQQIGLRLSGAFLGACFFLLHPLTVEPVAWISGFKDVGSMFWGLLATNIFLARWHPLWLRYLLATLCYGFSVTSKPSGLVFPLLAGFLALFRDDSDDDSRSEAAESHDLRHEWYNQGAPQKRWSIRPILVHPSFHAFLAFLVGTPIIWVSIRLQPALQMQQHVDWFERPLIAFDAILFYAQKIIWPVKLLPDYSRTPSQILQSDLIWTAGLGALIVLTSLAVFSRKPRLGCGLILAFIALSPNLGLIPFAFQDRSTVADRYAYLALVGVATFLAYLCQNRILRWLCTLSLPLLCWLTFVQAGLWRDQATLFRYVLALNPSSFVAMDGLGVEAYRRGDLQSAESYFRRALSLNSKDAKAWFNLGSTLWMKGLTKDATDALETSLKLDANHPDTLNNLGFIYAANGKEAAAESLYRRALLVNQLDLDARYNLARLLRQKGFAAEAQKLIDEAVKIYPGFAEKYLKVHH